MGGDGHDSAADNDDDDHDYPTNNAASETAGTGGADRAVLIPTGSSEDAVIAASSSSATAKKRMSRQSAAHSTTTANGSAALPGRRRVRKVVRDGTGAASSNDTDSSGNSNNAQAVFIKYAALVLLVAQMVGLVLLMRYSRTAVRAPEAPLYLASTAVFVMEIMKLVLCLLVVAYQTGADFGRELYFHVIASPAEILKLCVPSLLYTVQNNLLYLALTNLDAATYQVCYQLKILTTALFSSLLLQRTFSTTKWAALVVLTVGVAIVQLSGSGDHHHHSGGGTTEAVEHHSLHREAAALSAAAAADQAESHNRLVGLVAVICAACTSGFSGVYFGEFTKRRDRVAGKNILLCVAQRVWLEDSAACALLNLLLCIS